MSEERCDGCYWRRRPLDVTTLNVCSQCTDEKFAQGMAENVRFLVESLCNRLHKIDKTKPVVVVSEQEDTPDGEEEDAGCRENPA